MSKTPQGELTNFTHFFLEPSSPTHRQYEALRAFFIDRAPSKEVAKRFGYTPGSFRVLCSQFRQNPQRPFFLTPQRGGSQEAAAPRKGGLLRQQVIALRKQNLSIYDISDTLKREQGRSLSPAAIDLILKE